MKTLTYKNSDMKGKKEKTALSSSDILEQNRDHSFLDMLKWSSKMGLHGEVLRKKKPQRKTEEEK